MIDAIDLNAHHTGASLLKKGFTLPYHGYRLSF